MYPEISVIVPTYNRADLLAKTLASVSDNNYPSERLEIVVVDDGSTDDTFQRVLSAEISAPVTYVRQADDGYRLARARNLGLKVAGGALCIFVDCGVVVGSEFLRAHAEAVRQSAVVIGYVYGFANDDANDDAMAGDIDLAQLDETMKRFAYLQRYPDIRERVYRICGDDIDSLPAPWALAWGCNLAIDRSQCDSEVLYDEWYRSWGAEDLDFALSLHLGGAKFSLCRSAAAIHLPHPKSESSNTASSRPNKAYLHRKYNRPDTNILKTVSAVDLNSALLAADDFSR